MSNYNGDYKTNKMIKTTIVQNVWWIQWNGWFLCHLILCGIFVLVVFFFVLVNGVCEPMTTVSIRFRCLIRINHSALMKIHRFLFTLCHVQVHFCVRRSFFMMHSFFCLWFYGIARLAHCMHALMNFTQVYVFGVLNIGYWAFVMKFHNSLEINC